MLRDVTFQSYSRPLIDSIPNQTRFCINICYTPDTSIAASPRRVFNNNFSEHFEGGGKTLFSRGIKQSSSNHLCVNVAKVSSLKRVMEFGSLAVI